MNTQNLVLSTIIGLNPTGTMSYDGTTQMNGNNNIVNTSINASKKNISKIQNNEVVCDNIENFENYNKESHNKYLIILFFIIIFIIIFLFFYKKKS